MAMCLGIGLGVRLCEMCRLPYVLAAGTEGSSLGWRKAGNTVHRAHLSYQGITRRIQNKSHRNQRGEFAYIKDFWLVSTYCHMQSTCTPANRKQYHLVMLETRKQNENWCMLATRCLMPAFLGCMSVLQASPTVSQHHTRSIHKEIRLQFLKAGWAKIHFDRPNTYK